MTEENKRSPLHDWHVEHGADIMWEDGYPWNNHQGADPLVEYEAVRTATGIWDAIMVPSSSTTKPKALDLSRKARSPQPSTVLPEK